jgi:hypothetical protein
MKSAFFVFGFLGASFSVCSAQNPLDDPKRRLGERSNGNTGAIVIPSQPRKQTIISYITYLSKDREWADISGRKMTGRLVAFAAPEPGKEGPVVVTLNGKVRLRRSGAKANSDLPLAQLSQGDQLFVKAVEAGIKKNAAAAMPPKKAE